MTAKKVDAASGTRDFLASDVRAREEAFAIIRQTFDRYGFEPLQTPAFERLELLTGKYGEEGDKLVFKILRRGEHEASGEADLALRYDLTVPLARVVATYGSQLPSPYKRYAIAPVWRADRPGKGRFREFYQCDLDVVGSTSPLADAEVVSALADALSALGVPEFRFLVNSRKVLYALLDVFEVPRALGGRTLIVLDKLDKLPPAAVAVELGGLGLDAGTAGRLVDTLSGPDADTSVRKALAGSDAGRAGLAEVDQLIGMSVGQVGEHRIGFSGSLVRGLDYYTGPIYEVTAPGVPGSIASGGRYDGLVAKLGGPDLPACGGSLGVERILPLLPTAETAGTGLDVAVTVLDADSGADLAGIAGRLRAAAIRTGVYLGGSGKLARQLKWANDQHARYALLYGAAERERGGVTVRDMQTGEQQDVPIEEVTAYLAGRLAE
ncbi:histidine--tRNA ligase [Cryptosporangium sp. NPDC051539]|uniref:histidine--tRNA ligase n=1 Tax=Cryptosporangium sp. NPDC051539 TaxID=3363962 RepID=UPI00379E194A